MKRFISVMVVVASMGIGYTASAEVISEHELTRKIELDIFGVNSIIYEFTPKSYPNKICLMARTGHGLSLTCFDKQEIKDTTCKQ